MALITPSTISVRKTLCQNLRLALLDPVINNEVFELLAFKAKTVKGVIIQLHFAEYK